MKERPILFSGPMVRAILDGRKTQTRRVVKHIPALGGPEVWCHKHDRAQFAEIVGDYRLFCPHGAPGDRLWVKETFSAHGAFGDAGRIAYRADLGDDAPEPHGLHWKPSIFCTRKASRITLEIAVVRVERLNAISEADAIAEGSHRKIWITSPLSAGALGATGERGTHRDGYREIWEDINGAGSWAANPWCWVIEFKRITP